MPLPIHQHLLAVAALNPAGCKRAWRERARQQQTTHTHTHSHVFPDKQETLHLPLCVHILNSFSSAQSARRGRREKILVFAHHMYIVLTKFCNRRLAAVYCAFDCVNCIYASRASRGAPNEKMRCAMVDGWAADWRYSDSVCRVAQFLLV